MTDSTRAYHGVAIALHWLIALLIVGLLIAGNIMVRLDEADPLRYQLTQWHKSFGVLVLLLASLRLLWRLTHRPPPLPGHLAAWEVHAAGAAHLLLYLAMLVIPLSGWIMVSASPLEIPTLLFNGLPWPHLPPFDTLPNKAEVSKLFATIHEWSAWILLALLLAHVGAALRHRFVLRDEVMQRMSPRAGDGRWRPGAGLFTLGFVVLLAGLIAYGYGGFRSEPLAAGSSQVTFEFRLQGDLSEGAFTTTAVEMQLDSANPAASRLRATVDTASVTSGNSQIDSTLVAGDWFDVSNHPQAVFESDSFRAIDAQRYAVNGTLQIRGVTRDIEFTLNLDEGAETRQATGEFTVSRLDFGLGAESQADEEAVGYPVTIRFAFEVR